MNAPVFSPFLLFAALAGYIAVLVGVGVWAERAARRGHPVTQKGWVYALTLTVYCTSWTYFGSVGSAANSGLLFTAIYLGPTVLMIVAWGLIRRMIRLRRRYQFSSLIDLITQRYGRSVRMGAFITLVLLLAMLPYLGLQIRAVLESFTLVTGLRHGADTVWGGHFTDELMVLAIGLLTCFFGLRRSDTRERQHGLIAVLAVEAVVKLVAFLAVGGFLVWGVFDGVGDLLARLAAHPGLRYQFLDAPISGSAYLTWMSYLVLSMAAVLFLPRMFHVMVVEIHDERHLATAMWLFPAYLLLISLFVLPIAIGGLLLGYPAGMADWLVILIPFEHGPRVLTVLSYLGGFSAAVGMIMVGATTMAIMFSNHIVLPQIERGWLGRSSARDLRLVRWLCVFALLGLAYAFQKGLQNSYLLIQMGIISFAGVLQFVPVVLGGMYWPYGSRAGVWWGLSAGWLVWAYTLFLPAAVRSGLGDPAWLQTGPFGLAFLRPEALFGLELYSPTLTAVFWSLLANAVAYVVVSLRRPPDDDQMLMAEAYQQILEFGESPPEARGESVRIDLAMVQAQVNALFRRYVPDEEADILASALLQGVHPDPAGTIAGPVFLELSARVERTLAGTIGVAMARQAITQGLRLSDEQERGLQQTWAEQLAQLRISPRQLREQVDAFRSLQELAQSHAAAMEEKVLALEVAAQEQARLIAAQQESEGRFRQIADAAPVMIWMQDSLQGQDYFNAAWWEFAGGDRSIAPADGWLALVHLEDRDAALALIDQVMEAQWGDEATLRLRRADHEYRTLRLQLRSRVSPDGMFLGLIGSAIDITDLVLAEQALRRSKEQLEFMVEARTADLARAKGWSDLIISSAPVLIVGLDGQGRILLFNDYAVQLTGYPREAVLGQDWVERFIPDESRDKIRQVIADVEAVGDVVRRKENPIRIRSGALRMINWSSQVLRDDNGVQTILSFGVDVTERWQTQKTLEENFAALQEANRRLEEAQNQLLQSEKMASIGQLAAGVAHEINNPVGFVNSNLGTLRKYAEQMLALIDAYRSGEGDIQDTATREKVAALKEALDIEFLQEDLPALLKESEDGLLRVKKIVQDLKDFSHVNESEWQYADLNAGLESTLNVVWNEVKYKATVEKHYGAIPEVECLAAQLNQVFMNLIVNAVQAIDESQGMGRITLSTGQEGKEIWIEVADTGRGMTEEVKRRVFEPFFTTKPVGKGTGLGMSLSYSIIQKHHGRIDLDSTPGEGTRFRVWIPLHQADAASAGDRHD